MVATVALLSRACHQVKHQIPVVELHNRLHHLA